MHRVRWAIAGMLVIAGCSADHGPPPGPRFDDEGQARITCMSHQVEAPGARYSDESLRVTADTMALLRYYTANGRKPYCDGADGN